MEINVAHYAWVTSDVHTYIYNSGRFIVAERRVRAWSSHPCYCDLDDLDERDQNCVMTGQEKNRVSGAILLILACYFTLSDVRKISMFLKSARKSHCCSVSC